MPRNYTPIPGRRYQNYTKDDMQRALEEVTCGRLSASDAAKRFSIPRRTLIDKLSGKHPGTSGGQPVFSKTEEELIVNTLQAVSSWGYPLSPLEVRLLIKGMLDKQGRHETRFQNNLPGVDFLKSFIQRNKLSFRMAENVKRSRTQVNSEELSKYFDRMSDILEEVPPANIFNFDETNITDNPGAKIVLVRRGTKRVENCRDHSLVSISLMGCGSASGIMLPPMVVYKAQNLYETWTKGGPEGTVYRVSKNGWFDMETFTAWFKDVFLENTKHLNGKKVLLGDNLASHFSPEVIRLCQENEIYFTSLVPNATHLLQPLDVAVFKGMKSIWRSVLSKWRVETQRKGAIPKEYFPQLLNSLWNNSSVSFTKNLIAGFKACGLVPFNPGEVLKRIPSVERVNENLGRDLDDTLIDLLQKNRGTAGLERKPKRGKKITGAGENLAAAMSPEPSTSTSVSAIQEQLHDDDACGKCGVSFHNYRGPDWVQCLNCTQWHCGTCNFASEDVFYVCQDCNSGL